VWANVGARVAPGEAMDLRKVEAVGIGRARKDLYGILRGVEGGTHYLLLRFDRPVAALISHPDYLAFSELARQDALAKAVLQGKGYDPTSLSVQEFLDILAGHVKEETDAGR
jgi:antitoxin (DNA-binding transcriptional repressor) of toxin-antitoxin stability system